MKLLLELFLSFIKIGALSIGGGYASIPIIQEEVVTIKRWLTMTQFADIMTIAEMTPGPVAINTATFVGTTVAGLPGAMIATLGCVFPSFIIVLLLAFIYYRSKGLDIVQGILSGLRPAVVAMIASAALSLITTAFFSSQRLPIPITAPDLIAVFLFAMSTFLLRRFKLSPILTMAIAGIAGLILYSIV